jgi:hypothetical protein
MVAGGAIYSAELAGPDEAAAPDEVAPLGELPAGFGSAGATGFREAEGGVKPSAIWVDITCAPLWNSLSPSLVAWDSICTGRSLLSVTADSMHQELVQATVDTVVLQP